MNAVVDANRVAYRLLCQLRARRPSTSGGAFSKGCWKRGIRPMLVEPDHCQVPLDCMTQFTICSSRTGLKGNSG